MLVLKRKVGESFQVGDATVTLLGHCNGAARFGINAPKETPVYRSEVPHNRKTVSFPLEHIRRENRQRKAG